MQTNQVQRASDAPVTSTIAYAELKLFIGGEWVSGGGRKT